MSKPEPKTPPPYYEYSEIQDYMVEEHGVNMKKFWRWLVDRGDIHNGGYISVEVSADTEKYCEVEEVKYIIRLLREEFCRGKSPWIQIHTSW